MITPFDIEKKEFSQGVRGYSREEVDEFLDQIIIDLEKVIKENLRLKAEIAAVEQENAKLKASDGQLVNVLDKAHNLMDDISRSAEKRADVLLKNAQLDAELTVREAKARAQQLQKATKVLETRYNQFSETYKALLESELSNIESTKIILEQYDEAEIDKLINEPVGIASSDEKMDLNDDFKPMEMSELERELFYGDEPIGDSRKTMVIRSTSYEG